MKKYLLLVYVSCWIGKLFWKVIFRFCKKI